MEILMGGSMGYGVINATFNNISESGVNSNPLK
jgi:hypothetical protein